MSLREVGKNKGGSYLVHGAKTKDKRIEDSLRAAQKRGSSYEYREGEGDKNKGQFYIKKLNPNNWEVRQPKKKIKDLEQ